MLTILQASALCICKGWRMHPPAAQPAICTRDSSCEDARGCVDTYTCCTASGRAPAAPAQMLQQPDPGLLSYAQLDDSQQALHCRQQRLKRRRKKGGRFVAGWLDLQCWGAGQARQLYLQEVACSVADLTESTRGASV